MSSKKFFMREAIEIAKKGIYTASPNPLVGCVITEKDKIIARGYHKKPGSGHAEINALRNLKNKINKNMTMYISLEPCCHQGRTGPCTEAIIKSGIKKVIIAMLDPNPIVKGKGVKLLKKNGINVEVGVCKDEAKLINKGYIKRIEKKLPYVTAKQAVSADFRISGNKNSWISNSLSRKDVQKLRASTCAIMVGSNTVKKDNPYLTVRLNSKELSFSGKINNPTRIVLDTNLELDIRKYNFFKGSDKKIIFNSLLSATNEKKNIDYIKVKKDKNGLNLNSIFKILALKYEINNLLIEPGSLLLTSLIKKNLLDEFIIYKAPIIIGDKGLKSHNLNDKLYNNKVIQLDSVKIFGNDVRIKYKF